MVARYGKARFSVDRFEEQLGGWSLRFQDSATEKGFLTSCHTRLLSSCSAGSILVVCMALITIVHHAVLRNEAFSTDDAQRLRMIVVGTWILYVVFFSLLGIMTSFRLFQRCLPFFLLEVVVVVAASITLFGTLISNRYYLAKLHGYDPYEVFDEDVHYSDTAFLLLIDAIITATHIMLPVRWFVLAFSEVLAILISAFALFLLGSPEDSPFFTFACLVVLTACAVYGKRSQERSERRMFKQLVMERGLRYAAEHALSWSKERGGERRDDDAISQRTSATADTDESGVVFGGFNARMSPEDLLVHMEHLIDMGTQEHWLVNQADVKVWPDRVIGIGGFGCVVVAELHGTQVAMKLHRKKHQSKDFGFLTSMSNELRVLRRLRHPNIVVFFGACIDAVSGELALLFEWVKDARSLEKYIGSWDSYPPMSHRHKVLVDIACAVRYLHAQVPPVVHGDLKPGNILVEEKAQPHVKLLDFGLSRVLGSRPRPLGGTRGWKAPETIAYPKGAPRASADVYVMGLLMHFVVTGFQAAELQGEYAEDARNTPSSEGRRYRGQLMFENLPWPKDSMLSASAMELCRCCLNEEPMARPSMVAVHKEVSKWRPEGRATGTEDSCMWTGAQDQKRVLKPRTSQEPLDWRQGIQALMSMICKEYDQEISAIFNFYDPQREIIHATEGWLTFCGQAVDEHRSLFLFFPETSEIWPWMEEQVDSLMRASGISGSTRGYREGTASCGPQTRLFQQVRGRRPDDPECISYTAKVSVTFPDPQDEVHDRDAEGRLLTYLLRISIHDVTTYIEPYQEPQPQPDPTATTTTTTKAGSTPASSAAMTAMRSSPSWGRCQAEAARRQSQATAGATFPSEGETSGKNLENVMEEEDQQGGFHDDEEDEDSNTATGEGSPGFRRSL